MTLLEFVEAVEAGTVGEEEIELRAHSAERVAYDVFGGQSPQHEDIARILRMVANYPDSRDVYVPMLREICEALHQEKQP